MKDSGALLLAEIDGVLCGTVSLFAPMGTGSEIWRSGAYGLRHLAVAEEQRRRGLGRGLLATAEALAFQRGATCLCVHVPAGASDVASLFIGRGYLRDSDGDLDRGSFSYWEANYLPLETAYEIAGHAAGPVSSPSPA